MKQLDWIINGFYGIIPQSFLKNTYSIDGVWYRGKPEVRYLLGNLLSGSVYGFEVLRDCWMGKKGTRYYLKLDERERQLLFGLA